MGTARNGPWLKWLVGGIAAGMVLLGVIAYAMTTTDQRPFCASCHLMQEAAVTHKMGSHARLACNECHAPHQLLSKLPFKAQEGLRDFLGNITGKDIPRPLSLRTKNVVNTNCIACHAQTNINVASMDAKPYCIDCHRSVAHMRTKPISRRTVAHD
jgi:cytochrome c nitrite reductase small subunit